MSRNSKNARLHHEARQRKRAKQEGKTIVKVGERGPAKTLAKHGKRSAWWQKPGARPRPWWLTQTKEVKK